MKPKAQHLSTQRLDRLMLWSRLWLLRLAEWIVQAAGVSAPLDRALTATLGPRLNTLRKIICTLIVVKAAQRVKLAPRKSRRPILTPRGRDDRVLFGSRLRKLTRARDLRAKISALLTLLHNAEREIARYARRMRRGLTQIWRDLVPPPAQEAVALCVAGHACAVIRDTS